MMKFQVVDQSLTYNIVFDQQLIKWFNVTDDILHENKIFHPEGNWDVVNEQMCKKIMPHDTVVNNTTCNYGCNEYKNSQYSSRETCEMTNIYNRLDIDGN